MKFIRSKIDDVVICEPTVFKDNRGYFFESFRLDQLESFLNHKVDFIQDNESKSSYGTLRGLHFQTPPYEQSKLVRVIKGKILDVAVDIRKNSPTFAKHIIIELSEYNKKQLFIPKGFAHGFVTLEDDTIVNYKVDNYYSNSHEIGIYYDDKFLNIDWNIDKSLHKLSSKDLKQPKIFEIDVAFNYEKDYYD